MASIEEIRAKLLAQEEKKSGNFNKKSSGGDNAVYPFWNIDFDDSCMVRFLPDGDDTNDFFWVERLVIKLPFNGVVGQTDKKVFVTVPCMEMYGKQCQIMNEIRPWWKDDDLINLARTYYKKRSYLFQGFVTRSPLEEEGEGTGRNDLRRFVINSSIFDIIKQSLMDPDMEELPTDYSAGRDFKILKTKKGEWANYSSSSWSMKARSLEEGEAATIQEKGLYNLRDFLPNEPTEEEQAIIKEMFEASVNEEAYDPAKWGNHYRPAGVQLEGVPTKTTAPTTTASPAATETTVETVAEVETPAAPVVEEAAPAAKVDALAALRARASSTEPAEAPASAPAETSAPAAASGKEDVLAIIRERAAKQNG